MRRGDLIALGWHRGGSTERIVNVSVYFFSANLFTANLIGKH